MFFEKYLKNYQVLEKMCSCGNRYPIMCLAFYIGPKEKLTKSREYSVHQRNFLHFTHSMRWFCCSRLLPFITGKHSIFMQSIISIEKLSQRSSFSSLLVLFFLSFWLFAESLMCSKTNMLKKSVHPNRLEEIVG